jgi:hypothetical protein
VRSVAYLGFNVVHSDIDVVWFRDPYSYFMTKHTEPGESINQLNLMGQRGCVFVCINVQSP